MWRSNCLALLVLCLAGCAHPTRYPALHGDLDSVVETARAGLRKGNGDAVHGLAWVYRLGDGVAVDHAGAERLFILAARMGSDNSKYFLTHFGHPVPAVDLQGPYGIAEATVLFDEIVLPQRQAWLRKPVCPDTGADGPNQGHCRQILPGWPR